MKVFNASKNVLNASLLVMTALLAMTATVFALEDTKTAIGRGNTKAGDPVDIRSGNQVISEAFGSLPGAMPISVGWMYRGKDDTQGPMGRGTTLSTDFFIVPVGTDTTAVTNAIILVTPGNRRFKFLYGSTDSQGQRIFLDTKDPQFNNVKLVLPDNTVHPYSGSKGTIGPAYLDFNASGRMVFNGKGELIRMQDRFGNMNFIGRNTNGFTTSVSNASGAIYLYYEAPGGSGKLSAVKILGSGVNNAGRYWKIAYESHGQFGQITDPNGAMTKYEWGSYYPQPLSTPPGGVIGGPGTGNSGGSGGVGGSPGGGSGGGPLSEGEITPPTLSPGTPPPYTPPVPTPGAGVIPIHPPVPWNPGPVNPVTGVPDPVPVPVNPIMDYPWIGVIYDKFPTADSGWVPCYRPGVGWTMAFQVVGSNVSEPAPVAAEFAPSAEGTKGGPRGGGSFASPVARSFVSSMMLTSLFGVKTQQSSFVLSPQYVVAYQDTTLLNALSEVDGVFQPRVATWSAELSYLPGNQNYSVYFVGLANTNHSGETLDNESSVLFTSSIPSGYQYAIYEVTAKTWPGLEATAHATVMRIAGDGQGSTTPPSPASALPVLLGIIDRSNHTRVQNYYDLQGRVVMQISADGGIWEFTYNQGSTTVKDPNFNLTTYNFIIDGDGYDISSVTNAQRETTTYTRDAQNRVIAITDYRGRVSTFTYDTNGNIVSATTPALSGTNTDTIVYDSTWNMPISFTDARGRTTTCQLNSSTGQIISVTSTPTVQNPQGMKTEFEYNALGLVSKVKRVYVPNLGDPTTTSTLQMVYSYTYTGQINYIENTIGQRKYFSYDDACRLYAIRNPNDSALRYAYNNMDQVVQVGFTDNYLSPSATTMATYYYDVEGRLASYVNPLGRSWSWTYDVMDRPLTSTDPIGAVTHTQYDYNGNIVRAIDNMGHEARPLYNIGYGDRLESERYYNQNPGSTGSPDVVVNYSYDFPTHLLKSTSTTGNSSQGITSGTWQYFYNTLDQVSAVSGPDGYESVSLDNYGRANSTTKNGVQTEEFEYDNLDRVTAVNNSRVLASPLGTQTRRVEFGYDSLGRNTGYSSSGMGKSVTYDLLSRVTSDTTAAGSASVTHDYSYDYSGRIYSDKTTYNSAGSTSSFYTDYFSYDTLGRLTGATVRGSTFGYTYDLAGNRLTETKDSVTKGFSYDNANRMLYASIGTQFSSAMSYDGNGKLTQISSTGNMGGALDPTYLSWNLFGNLVGNGGGSGRTYAYDINGNRKSSTNSNTSSTTQFSFYGANRGSDLTVGTDKYLETESGDKVIQNSRGDVNFVVGSNGSALGRYYDPFGNKMEQYTTGTGAAPSSDYGFTGREEDGTGLVYMRARYYHPGMGRFISQDPIGFGGGMNLYAYCSNDPINFTDPSGLTRVYVGFGQYFDTGDMSFKAGIDPNQPLLQFDLPGIGRGLRTAGAAAGSIADDLLCPSPDKLMMMTNPAPAMGMLMSMTGLLPHWSLYDGGSYKYNAGFGQSKFLFGVGAAAMAAADGLAAMEGACAGALGKVFGKVCFVAGTPVLMADGSSKAIESVKAGDMVISKDEKTGEIVKQKVVSTKVRTADATLVIETAGGGHVETTAEHPFYVEGKGWTPADQLAIGNAIVSHTGPSVKVTRVEKRGKSATVYNFEVEGTHSYFVGDGQPVGITSIWLWVHNDCFSIARDFLRMEGGEIWEITPTKGQYLAQKKTPVKSMLGPNQLDEFGDPLPWIRHGVHIKNGMVKDPLLLGNNEAISLEKWKSLWNFFDLYNFRKIK